MTPPPAPRILIADDQPDVLEALRLLLKPEGFAIDTVKSPAAVIKAVESRDFALALIDLNRDHFFYLLVLNGVVVGH